MRTRMYDCGFGDCFRLDEGEEVLYVDFGIHRQSKRIEPYLQTQYDRIIEDIPENCDFLLTHYHEDHYDGVIYMAQKTKKRFNNVYIPDIWNNEDSVTIVALKLYRGLLYNEIIKNKLTLYDFLISICKTNSTIHFVKRGSSIQSNYTALWPDLSNISKKAQKLSNAIITKYGDINQCDSIDCYETIQVLASKLIRIVMSISEMSSTREARNSQAKEQTMDLIGRLESEKEEYMKLADSFIHNLNNCDAKTYKKASLQQSLSKFGNEISIVFQNSQDSYQNILFTGDIPNNKAVWKILESANNPTMHNKYSVIKIPHHGTNISQYYHSFALKSTSDTKYLIPNGVIHSSGWYTCDRYASDANMVNAAVVCANNKACSALLNGKGCNRCRNIYAKLYEDF